MPTVYASLELDHLLDSDIITIRIGKDDTAKTYHIPSGLIGERVRYLRAAPDDATPGFGEPLVLEDVDPTAFRSFLTWIYTEQVCLEDGEVFEPDDGSSEHGEDVQMEDAEQDEQDEQREQVEQEEQEEQEELDDKNDKNEDGEDDQNEEDEGEGDDDGENYEEDDEYMADVQSEESDEERDKEDQTEEEESDADLPEPADSEALEKAVWQVWKHTKPSDLDAYQLRILLKVYRAIDMPELDPEVEEKLQTMLEEKEEATGPGGAEADEEPPTALDRLIELYIVASRFDASDLCTKIIELMAAEHDAQEGILGGKPLPS